jgi:glycosyltransferase involved in cell wall biosynthesis
MWTLSVCIPIYNSDVRALVNTLCAQIAALSEAAVDEAAIDIVLIDDASAPEFTTCNLFSAANVKFIALPQNIGRSRIRNAFLNHTDADYLLFIDGDSTIQDPLFLKKYADYLTLQPIEVLVGASVYQNHQPNRSQRLRWSYSTQRESLDYHRRTQSQHAGFKTNNFIIRRSVLLQNPFDERLAGYGHEDTLLGLQLAAQQIHIIHIDNPVWNLKLDTNAEFLSKTDNALKNLLWLDKRYPSLRVDDHIRLLQLNVKLNQYVVFKYLMGFLSLTIPFFAYFLKTGYAPLFLFDLYRLLRLQQLNKNALHDIH